MINQIINQVVQYGLSKHLLEMDDQVYVLKRLFELFKVNEVDFEEKEQQSLENNIDVLVKYAIKNNIIKNDSLSERIIFESKIMDCLMPRPSELNKLFRSKYKKSPQQATKFFHNFSLNSHYIMTENIEDNLNFSYVSQYGNLEMIVNISKPAPLHFEQVSFNDRANHREASISVNNETNAWTIQFMPYPYVEEHLLISRKDHLEPYNNDKTFAELIDFINKFPQYYIASDMSIALSEKSLLPYHYLQGGKHLFPIESAEVIGKYKNSRVQIEVLNWPVSAIRLIGNNENKLLDVMHDLHHNWIQYSNEKLMIQANTNEEIHNLVDVMIKLDGSKFNVYMIFKNNRKTDEYPQGIFQPKKEMPHSNFGVLEDLGIDSLSNKFYKDLMGNQLPTDSDNVLINQVGQKFEKSLEETNVFKFGKKEDFISFIEKAV